MGDRSSRPDLPPNKRLARDDGPRPGLAGPDEWRPSSDPHQPAVRTRTACGQGAGGTPEAPFDGGDGGAENGGGSPSGSVRKDGKGSGSSHSNHRGGDGRHGGPLGRASRQVFVSYVQEDGIVAREIAAALEQQGYTTWYYERDSQAGLGWPAQICEAIEKADVVVMAASRAALRANAIMIEVGQAFFHGKPLIPVLLHMRHDEFMRSAPHALSKRLDRTVSVSIPKAGVGAVVPELVQHLEGLGIKPARETPAPAPPKGVKRWRMRLIAAALGLVAVLACGLYVHNTWRRGGILREAEEGLQDPSPDARRDWLPKLEQLGGSRAVELALAQVDPESTPQGADRQSEDWAQVRREASLVVLHTTTEHRRRLLALRMADPWAESRELAARRVEEGYFDAIPWRERLMALLRGLTGQAGKARDDIDRVARGLVGRDTLLDPALRHEVRAISPEAGIWLISAISDYSSAERGLEAFDPLPTDAPVPFIQYLMFGCMPLFRHEEVAALIAPMLDDSAEKVRETAIRSMPLKWWKDKVGRLSDFARNDDARPLQRAATALLGDLRTADALKVLTEMARRVDGPPRPEVPKALGAYADAAAPLKLSAIEALTGMLRDGMLRPKELLDDYKLVLGEAARSLGKHRAEAAVPHLGELLVSSEQPLSVRTAVVQALGAIGSEEAKESLRAALVAKQNDRVLRAVIQALGSLRDTESVPKLVAIVRAGPEGCGAAAADALSQIGVETPDVISALAEAMRRIAGPNRKTYTASLGKLATKDSFGLLVGMLSPEDEAFQFREDVFEIISQPPDQDGLRALIDHGLTSPELTVREASYMLLTKQAKASIPPFDASAPPEERERAIQKIREWLERPAR